MEIHNVEQGSDEWFAARMGVPSASQAGMILSPTGKPSTQAGGYMNKLLGQWLTGESENFTSEAMNRGTEMEPEARAWFELSVAPVEQVGFIVKDGFGCSPDGLVGEDSGLEIKCPMPPKHASYLIAQKLPTEYIPQVQSSMYVTGRGSWNFVSYHPKTVSMHIVVQRDEEWIKLFEEQLDKFKENLENAKQKLQAYRAVL